MDNFTELKLYNLSYPSRKASSANWNFSAVLTITECLLAFSLNSSVLICFLSDKDLRKQPFNIYLICLLICNILYTVVENPLEVVDYVGSVWTFGVTWCMIYKYAQTVVPIMQMFSHVLITLSRVWAMTFPHSYRQKHTRMCAILLCVGMVLYSQIVYLPTLIPAATQLKLPLETYGCFDQFQPTLLQQFLTYVPALGIVLVAYPLLASMHRKRTQSRNSVGHTDSIDKTTKNVVAAKNVVAEVPTKTAKQKVKRRSQSFFILTLLTCSILIFWSPAIIVFTVARFVVVPYPLLFQVAQDLLAVQPIMDPLLFTVAMKDVRSKLQKICCFRSS